MIHCALNVSHGYLTENEHEETLGTRKLCVFQRAGIVDKYLRSSNREAHNIRGRETGWMHLLT